MSGATATSRGSVGNRSEGPEVVLPAPAGPRRGRAVDPGAVSCGGSVPGSEDVACHSDVMRAVAAFHAAFDLPRQPLPCAEVSAELAQLRVDLLVEEVGEFADATRNHDIVAMADALGDIVYVAYGAAVTYGIDLDAVVAEIHRSNMSKLDAAGRPVLREDGKVLKSSRYRPPDVKRVLAEQLALPLVFDELGGIGHR